MADTLPTWIITIQPHIDDRADDSELHTHPAVCVYAFYNNAMDVLQHFNGGYINHSCIVLTDLDPEDTKAQAMQKALGAIQEQFPLWYQKLLAELT